jgi:DNA-binding NarL/FixJ family response regulator
MRQGLRLLLMGQPDFQVVGEADDGREALQLAESLHPDVLVLDMAMPDMSGAEVTRQMASHSPATAVVILSMHRADAYVRQAMQAGARAYVLKESTADELVDAINEVVAGRRYLSRTLTEHAVEWYVKGTAAATEGPYSALSKREYQVLALVAKGWSAGQIGTELNISSRTVEFHRASIMRKLGLRNQKELIHYCATTGCLPGDY